MLWRVLYASAALCDAVLDGRLNCRKIRANRLGSELTNISRLLLLCCMQVYKGVVPPGEFSGMVDELVSGPCIAVEVRQRV